jgi:hypothetical protein
MKKRRKQNAYALVYDIVIIALGIAVMAILVKTGVVSSALFYLRDYTIISSFVAGIFFTSTFTIAPASLAIVQIAHNSSIPTVALWGALGAMIGDLILFFFIRDRFYKNLIDTIKPSTVRRVAKSFHFGFLKWLAPFLGALIIASPLPDELGLSLLGMSKVKVSLLMPMTFAMNFIGIYALIGFANLIS